MTLYRQLSETADLDALHDLIVRHGPSILEAPLPYLVVAIRNQRRSTARRDARRAGLSSKAATLDARSTWDPLDWVLANEDARQLAEALAELDERDAFVLWLHASGVGDDETIALWDDLGFEPVGLTRDALRKRRQRARSRLRARLTDTDVAVT